MILDTTVLVDLQRELRRNEPGGASALLERFGDERVSIAFVTWMEFAEGFADDRREDCERFLSSFPVLWLDIEVSWEATGSLADCRPTDARSEITMLGSRPSRYGTAVCWRLATTDTSAVCPGLLSDRTEIVEEVIEPTIAPHTPSRIPLRVALGRIAAPARSRSGL